MPLLSDPTPLLRLMSPNYGDGVGSLLPGADPVEIARVVFDQEGDMPNPAGWSTLMVNWGQFLDHDLSLTRDASGEFITVPGLIGPFQRSVHEGGLRADEPRQPLSEITPELDASMIYGSTDERMDALRSHQGGRLRTSEDPDSELGLMPMAEEGEVMAGAHHGAGPLFLAGDIRANENIGLTTLQTLMMREHNYWADRLAGLHLDWDDAQLFQAARSIVEAEIQGITYRDWLPTLLVGNEGLAPVAAVLAPSSGYDPTVDGRVSVEFSTAAFRVGHTMVASEIPLLDASGNYDPDQSLSVMEAFFSPAPLLGGGMDALLRSQAGMPAQAVDAKVIDDLNFFLVSGDGVVGFSLAALNILRGRDHGLASYLDTRAALLGDVDPAAVAAGDFSVITSDAEAQATLAQVYDSVHDVGLWVGGLSEDRSAGAQLGPVFAWIVADQFLRSRAADESFGDLADALGSELAAEVAATSLRDIMLRNSGVDYMQANPFLHADRSMGTAGDDRIMGAVGSDMIMGLDGQDTLLGSWGKDALYGGDGADLMLGGGADDMLVGDAGNDRLYGGNGNDRLAGGLGNDRLGGNNSRDTLDGGDGDDWLSGGSGNDLLLGGAGNDTLLGGGGYDRLQGGAGNDRLFGNLGYDLLEGGGGNDFLQGGGGNDTLDGGAGNDRLFGWHGSDTFRFSGDFGTDRILDFDTADPHEKIDLSGVASIIDMADLLANHMNSTAQGALILDGASNMIWINDVQPWELDASDFLF